MSDSVGKRTFVGGGAGVEAGVRGRPCLGAPARELPWTARLRDALALAVARRHHPMAAWLWGKCPTAPPCTDPLL